MFPDAGKFPPELPNLTLVLGGAASGKSDLGEAIVRSWDRPRTYIATAQALDDEMEAKIAAHRAARREQGWTTLEAPHDVVSALSRTPPEGAALLDGLTLWLSNRLLAGADPEAETAALRKALSTRTCPLCLVSDEVGMGVVPDTALGRRFREALGRLNRAVAAEADAVVGVMAGLPFALKGPLPGALT